MRQPIARPCAIAGVLLLVLSVEAAKAQRVQVVLDPSGSAMLVEQKQFDLQMGLNEVIWDNVSSQLDAGSVQLRSVDRPSTLTVVNQDYDFDLASRQALLNRYLGKSITLVRRDQDGKETERTTGKLISAEGARVAILQMPDGQLRLDPGGEILLSPLLEAKGPSLVPRLVFKVDSKVAAKQTLELSYVTRGLSWSPNYNLSLNSDATLARIVSWLTLSNSTNLTFTNARWRLLAEEVRRREAFQPVDERVTFEYQPSCLQGPVTLAMGDSLRMPLTISEMVEVEQRLVFDPIGSGPAAPTPPQKLRLIARFRNDTAHGLGVSMPGGRAVISREMILDEKTKSSVLRQIADTSIPTTAQGKYFDFSLGDSPGLEGERKQTAFRQAGDRMQEQDIEITIRNQMKEPARVIVVEHPWGNYEIVEKSHTFVKQDDGSIEFNVQVPDGGSETITYRIKIRY